MFLVSILSLLTASCGFKIVDDGNVAIVVDSFSKNIHQQYRGSGVSFAPLTTFNEVSSTDIRLELENLQPKDKKGMKFEDVDLSVTVRLIPEKAVTLYTEPREINFVSHIQRNVLAYTKMVQILKSSATKAFQSLDY